MLVVAGVVVLVLLVASQVLLPRIAASQIEHRLTKDGGHAKASRQRVPGVGASCFSTARDQGRPATAFASTSGARGCSVPEARRLQARARAPDERNRGALRDQELRPQTRGAGSDTYTLVVRTSFTPSQLAGYLGSQVGGGHRWPVRRPGRRPRGRLDAGAGGRERAAREPWKERPTCSQARARWRAYRWGRCWRS